MIDVNKAKQKILDLAISGKLTKQLKSDGNAEDLFIEIQKEKERLIKEKKIKNDKNIIDEDIEEPFEIPNNWKWCIISDIVENITAGGDKPKNLRTKPDEKHLIPVFSNGERNSGLFGYTNEPKIFPPALTISARGTIGYTEYRDVPFVPIVRLITITSKYDVLLKFLNYYFRKEIVESVGSTTQQITIPMLVNLLVPVPPLAEQKRIVEKVEVLFGLLDKIDESQKKYQKDKEILKTKIIEAGIRGKLTKQLNSDGNAKDLYDKIQKEKEKLIEEGKIKRDKKETYIYKKSSDNLYYEKYQDGTEKCINVELPFEIPENWIWCKQEQVCSLYNGELSNNEDLPYLEAKVLRGKKNATSAKKGVKVNKGDYAILVDGENSGEVMKVPYSGYMGSTFKILLVYYNKIADYIKYNIDLERKGLKENKTGSAIPHLNKKIFKGKIIPLPPLAEQERIVEAIEKILCIINDK